MTHSFFYKIAKKHSINSVALFVPEGAEIILGIITLPIILNSIPISEYGQLQFVLVIQVWALALTAPYMTIGSRAAVAKNDYATFVKVFKIRALLILAVWLIAVLSSFALFFLNLKLLGALTAIIFTYLFMGYLPNISYTNFLIGKKEFKRKSFLRVIELLLAYALSTWIAVHTQSAIYYIGVRYLVMSILSWIFFFDTNREFSIFKTSKKQKVDGEIIKYGYSLIPSHLINLSNNLISSTIISYTAGFGAYSIYQVAANLRQKAADIMKFIHPLLYADFSTKNEQDIFKKIRPYTKNLFILSTVLTIFVILGGSLYIKLFFNDEYQIGILYYIILSLVFPASIVTLILLTAFEAKLKGKLLQKLSISTDIVKTILTAVGSILAGPIGATVSFSVGGWAAYFLYSDAFNKKFLKKSAQKEKLSAQ